MSAPAPSSDLAAVAAELRAARKYRDVAPEVLERVARDALVAARRRADAVKRAKSKLHQIHAAFAPERELAHAEQALAALLASEERDSPAAIESLCAQVLRAHASTRERPRDLAPLYRELFARTGPPASVLDLGCGLHPFALPWMGLPRSTPYRALDLDRRGLALVDRLLRQIGQRGGTECADLLDESRSFAADVILALKLLPTLERQSKGAAARLLDRLEARSVVLSFPTASLGRRSKGMPAHYAHFTAELLEPRGWRAEPFATREELFVVATPPRRSA